MKHVSVIVPSGAVLSGIEIARHLFEEANQFLIAMEKEPVFKVQLVGAEASIQLNNGLFTIQPETTIKKLKQTDLIIIPALYADLEENLARNETLIAWMRKQYEQGAEVASLCVGAFLLAKTGIVNGKACTTHWKAAEYFRHLFPDVKLETEKIITDQEGVYSSGGGFSLINLLIYIIEKYAGREVAIQCAKFFQIDMERDGQLPFMIFQGQKQHGDEQIKQAQLYIEHNYSKRITAGQLAEMLTLGRRSLERRFKKATSNTLNEYILRVKIEAAKKQLETSARKINDIMYEVGYTDNRTFRTSFKMVTGLLPNEYRSKYNKRAVEV